MRDAKYRQGIVLLMVLGILALMSVLAITFVQMAQMERSISENYVLRTRAHLAAESGLEYALARLGTLAGVLSNEDAEDLRFEEDPLLPGLRHARKLSFEMPHGPVSEPVLLEEIKSGIVGSSVTTDSDFYKLAVFEESAKLNLNDSNQEWNIDTDPWVDGGPGDPDQSFTIPNRLTSIVHELCTVLFDDFTAVDVTNTLFDETSPGSRPTLPGGVFANMDQIKDLLVPVVLDSGEFKDFAANVTLYSWQDPNVIRPTFQLAISGPGTVPADEFDIYMYSDFQTKYFELEPRSPVNVNTASLELIEALIRPIQGWYLYEGAPASFMDGLYGPWRKTMRHSGRSYKDKAVPNGYPGTHYWPMEDGLPEGTLSPKPRESDSKNWNLGRGTRYGQAQLTKPLDPYAADLAAEIYDYVHGLNGKPFRTWDEFSRFIYSQVDTSSTITSLVFGNSQSSTDTVLDYDLSGGEEAQRFPYRISEDSDFTTTALPLIGFDRYMADALLANFNPNSQLNDYNPDYHIFRHVDKAQLTQHTTEFSFSPTGSFKVQSLGLIVDENGLEVASTQIDTVIKVYHLFRQTTQAQFMKGYDRDNPETMYDLFQESDGMAPTAGANLIEEEGSINPDPAIGRWGPSVTSYPEPFRFNGSLSVEGNPNLDHTPGHNDYFSPFEGYLMLSTYQLDADSWLIFSPAAQPQFMAPMSYRDLTVESVGNFHNRSLAVGNMMPVRYGKNDSGPYPGIYDDLDTLNVPGGRGTVLAWIEDYAAPDPGGSVSGADQGIIDMIMNMYPDYPNGVDQSIIDLVNGMSVAAPATTDRNPSPVEWIHNAPWEDRANWHEVSMDDSDHWWFGMGMLGPTYPMGFILPRFSTTWRPTWNLPSDMPLTPVAYPGWEDGNEFPNIQGGVVQGNLFADGTFSDTSRMLSYPSSNMGSEAGSRGSIFFWFKPHWDTGFSNRIRSIFNMGDTTTGHMHGLDLLYFPVGHRPDGTGPNEFDIGAEYGYPSINRPGPWSQASHSFFCGWLDSNWNVTAFGHGNLEESRYRNSSTATDFFPNRDDAQRASHFGLSFYGHQWNMAAISYDAKEYRKYNVGLTNSGVNSVDYMINGSEINTMQTVSEYVDLFGLSWQPVVDFWWEEDMPVHLPWTDPDTSGFNVLEPKPQNIPINLEMGETYMRFGWSSENNGPTGDSTYDDITAWAQHQSLTSFSSVWSMGRYCGEPLFDENLADPNITAAGLYTSTALDLFREIPELSLMTNTSVDLKAVMWTGYWPRYNWRPNGSEATIDHDTWTTWADFNGMDGVSIVDNEFDPVTGEVDPFTIDVRTAADEWLYSGDTDADDNNLFANMDQMAASAGTSRFTSSNTSYFRGDDFQYRIYFQNSLGESLLESPVLDDITFIFTSSKPIIQSYKVIN